MRTSSSSSSSCDRNAGEDAKAAKVARSRSRSREPPAHSSCSSRPIPSSSLRNLEVLEAAKAARAQSKSRELTRTRSKSREPPAHSSSSFSSFRRNIIVSDRPRPNLHRSQSSRPSSGNSMLAGTTDRRTLVRSKSSEMAKATSSSRRNVLERQASSRSQGSLLGGHNASWSSHDNSSDRNSFSRRGNLERHSSHSVRLRNYLERQPSHSRRSRSGDHSRRSRSGDSTRSASSRRNAQRESYGILNGY